MFAYWLMFSIPAFAVLSPWRGTKSLQLTAWAVVGVLFTLIIGFRYQVGGDWFTYIEHYQRVEGAPLIRVLDEKDIGYGFLNWLVGVVGGEVYLVNLICGAIVMSGVVAFSIRQPLPWLALLIAVPYMLIVVAMGYTRQSAALGFELLALVSLMDGSMRRFVFFTACGALFHKSAILLLPLAMLASSSNRFWTLFWVGLTGAGLASAILAEHYELLWEVYVGRGRESQGGPIRVAMNALRALLLLVFRNKLSPDPAERRLWVWIAVFALACVPLVGLASTAVDRVALYFLPIQLYVFSRVHHLFSDSFFKTVVVVGVVIGYGLVQWVWLNFANHAAQWVPYQFFPLV
jgi:hypothetical protein